MENAQASDQRALAENIEKNIGACEERLKEIDGELAYLEKGIITEEKTEEQPRRGKFESSETSRSQI